MTDILTLVGVVLLAQVSPGPNSFAVASVTLGSGRTSGLATSAGIATGALIWAAFFSLGVGTFIATSPSVVHALRLVGGFFLMAFGLRALWRARRIRDRAATSPRVLTPRRAYTAGLAVVMANPKAALLWVSVTALLASLGLGRLALIATGAAVAASGFVIYGAHALLFSTARAERVYGDRAPLIEFVIGLAFLGFGATLFAATLLGAGG